MKKNNNKRSVAKTKRSIKNKKRLSKKNKLSKFERKEIRKLDELRSLIPLTLAKARGRIDGHKESSS